VDPNLAVPSSFGAALESSAAADALGRLEPVSSVEVLAGTPPAVMELARMAEQVMVVRYFFMG
jgi:hypothetical protein